MSPRHHFADYQKRDPQGYQTFCDSLWNSFVTVTHGVGLNRFFSFTPDFLQGKDNPVSGRFSEGEIPGDKEPTYTQLTLW
jgi:hypothetical protein